MNQTNHMSIDRPPVAAGRFYPGSENKLKNELEMLFSAAGKLIDKPTQNPKDLIALVAPHAGYVYSGTVAASAFHQLKDINPRNKVFLIGSSHHTDFNGASIYNRGDYSTPLGRVKVDQETAETIIHKSTYCQFVSAAHAHEHCLEVLLPFLQHVWKDEFEIIPIILATHNKRICKEIARELQPWFNKENLFVISTDLSHYPEYENAVDVDRKTIEAVLTGEPEKLLDQIRTNESRNIPNLATSMCGWTSVLTLMHLAEESKEINYSDILYQNSGDAKFIGESDRVVGYQSIALYKENIENEFILSEKDKALLLKTTRKSIEDYPVTGERLKPDIKGFSESLQTKTGAFVSIYLNNELRGCIGHIESQGKSLVEIVADVAVSAAYYDNRFTSVTDDEIKNTIIEISVLTPLKKIESIDEIEMGRHGILIRKGFNSGTFLPQVAEKTNWTREEFIGNCSKNKAHLGWDGWKDAELYTYEAIIIKEE